MISECGAGSSWFGKAMSMVPMNSEPTAAPEG